MPPFRPMLSAKFDNAETVGLTELSLLTYPLIVSPKIDGIRCFIHPEAGPVSRTVKPIPNKYTRAFLEQSSHWHGLDGELVPGIDPTKATSNLASSAFMSHDGTPNFTYWVFDQVFNHETRQWYHNHKYAWRHLMMRNMMREFEGQSVIRVLEQEVVDNAQAVLDYEARQLALGYEGIIIRAYDGAYKFGRSTLKQQGMIKMKRFTDAEAEIVAFEPLYRNHNEAVKDVMGLTKRSSHQANMVADDTLGKFVLRDLTHPEWGNFSCGSGLDDETRDKIWKARPEYLGKKVKFKYLAYGSKDKPRHPIFLGIRHPEDM